MYQNLLYLQQWKIYQNVFIIWIKFSGIYNIFMYRDLLNFSNAPFWFISKGMITPSYKFMMHLSKYSKSLIRMYISLYPFGQFHTYISEIYIYGIRQTIPLAFVTQKVSIYIQQFVENLTLKHFLMMITWRQ